MELEDHLPTIQSEILKCRKLRVYFNFELNMLGKAKLLTGII